VFRFSTNLAKAPQTKKTITVLNLPQQAQTQELISGHTYIRKRISLTFFVKKLIL